MQPLGGMQPLVPLVFHNLPSPSFTDFWLCRRGDRTRTAPLRRYTRSHKPRIVHTTSLNFHDTRARGRSRRGTLSKMASFIVDSCRDQRFSLEMWDWRRTIAWGRRTPMTIVDQFGTKISGFTPSFEALGQEEEEENSDFTHELFLVWRDEGS